MGFLECIMENNDEELTKKNKLATATSYGFMPLSGGVISSANPWGPDEFDKLGIKSKEDFESIVTQCRFFYQRDPIASTVINKMIDIGINDLTVDRKNLSANEVRLVEGMKDELVLFAEAMALEYLVSGLVIPEIKYARVGKNILKEFGIKRYDTLILPESMWIRDPATVKINSTFILDEPSFYVKVPDELVFFITNDGTYPDNTKDKDLYNKLVTYYPDFVRKVKAGEKYILLENSYIFRRRVLSNSPYPTPFLYPALEALKHKRNIRRMDYAIAARVIGAIQLFKLGSDEFPVTEDQQDEQFNAIRDQMAVRGSYGRNVERIFQLFANHTLNVEWVYPPVDALLDSSKYQEVNQDIIFALGFPRILITGETERTGTSDPEYAMMSPLRTIRAFRKKIIRIINAIVDETLVANNMKGTTVVKFEPMQMTSFEIFVGAMAKLYETGNVSREEFAKVFGYDINEELLKRKAEKELLEKYGLQEFNPQPFSPQDNPNQTGNTDSLENNDK